MNPDLAEKKLDDIISESETNETLKRELVLAYIWKAEIKEMRGDLAEAMAILQHALPLAELLPDESLVPSVKRNIAHVKLAWGDPAGALDELYASMKIAKLTKDTSLQGVVLNDLALTHNELGNPQKALVYLKEELSISDSTDLHDRAIILNNMGNTFVKLGDYEKALDLYFESLSVVTSKKLKFGIRENLSDIGQVYQKMGNWEIALNYNKDALALSKELSMPSKEAEELLHISRIYYNQKEYKQSIANTLDALDLLNSDSKLQNKASAYKLLSENYEMVGEYNKGLHFRKEYEMVKDSLTDSKKTKEVLELDMRFQNERQEAENVQLKLVQAEQDIKLKKQSIISLIIGTGFLIVLGFLVFITLQNEQKKVYNQALEEEVYERTKELEGALSELERFTYIASHDLKEPLRNISGFVSLIERNIEKDKPAENREYIQFVKKNTKQLYDLIQDILNYSSLKQNDEQVRTLTVDNMIARFKEEHSIVLESKQTEIQVDDTSNLELPTTLYLAIKNILSNGIKYNDKPVPKLHVSSFVNNEQLSIRIKDNGIGIDPKYFNKIFKMFTRLHDRGKYNGSGLGLSISKKVIDHFNGNVRVESKGNEGSTFIITLPVQDDWYSNETRKSMDKVIESVV